MDFLYLILHRDLEKNQSPRSEAPPAKQVRAGLEENGTGYVACQPGLVLYRHKLVKALTIEKAQTPGRLLFASAVGFDLVASLHW